MSSLSSFEILGIYKTNVLKFLDNLVELLPDESEIIIMKILFENQIPVEESMRKLCTRLFTPINTPDGPKTPSDMLKTKQESFFLNNSHIFIGMDDSKLSRWKEIWKSKRLDKSDKDAIFNWFTLFLNLAEMYQKNEMNAKTCGE